MLQQPIPEISQLRPSALDSRQPEEGQGSPETISNGPHLFSIKEESMRITIPATLLVALLVACPVARQEIQFASYGDIQTAYEAQNQEITHLRGRLDALESSEDEGNGFQACDTCCCSSCC